MQYIGRCRHHNLKTQGLLVYHFFEHNVCSIYPLSELPALKKATYKRSKDQQLQPTKLAHCLTGMLTEESLIENSWQLNLLPQLYNFLHFFLMQRTHYEIMSVYSRFAYALIQPKPTPNPQGRWRVISVRTEPRQREARPITDVKCTALGKSRNRGTPAGYSGRRALRWGQYHIYTWR
jgi:hypothetical protein